MFRQDYSRLSIFADLSCEQISQLSPYMVECKFAKDAAIFHQGQRAEHFYILLQGEVEVRYKPYDGPALTVAHIGSGGVFGWSSALKREVYTSGAIAVQASTMIRIRGESLQSLCAEAPETAMLLLDRLASVIAERLDHTHHQVLQILTQGMDIDGNCLRRNTKQ